MSKKSERDRNPDVNCFGYTFYALGIDPQERMIQPHKVVIDEHFTRVPTIEEADAIAAVADANRERRWGEKPSLVLHHMAVVDKKKAGYVTERPHFGAPIRRLPAEEAFRPYLQPKNPEDIHELVYLKRKRNKT
jgi:hypothetical protein